jgi:hypothetical protein
MATVKFSARDILTDQEFEKQNGFVLRQAPKKVFTGSIEEVNAEINAAFKQKNIIQASEWIRYPEEKTLKINELVNANAKSFVDMASRRPDLFSQFKRKIAPGHVTRINNSLQKQAFDIAYKNYFKFVKKKDVIEFTNKMEYIRSSGFIDKTGKRLVEGEAFGEMLDQINQEIMAKGRSAYNNGQIFRDRLDDILAKAKPGQAIDFSGQDYKNFVKGIMAPSANYNNLIDGVRQFLDNESYDIDLIVKQLHSDYDNFIKEAASHGKEFNPRILDDFIGTFENVVNSYKLKNESFVALAENKIYKNAANLNNLDKIFGWGVDEKSARVGFGKFIGMRISDLGFDNISRIINTPTDVQGLSAAKKYAIQQTQLHVRRYAEMPRYEGMNWEDIFNRSSVKVGVRGYDSAVNEKAAASLKRLNNAIKDQARFIKKQGPSKTSTVYGQQQARETAKQVMDQKKIPVPDGVPTKTIKGLWDKAKGVGGKVLLAATALGMAANIISQKTQQSPLAPSQSGGSSGSSGGSRQQAPFTGTKTVYSGDSSGGHYLKMSAKSASAINQMDAADKIGREMGGNGSVDIRTYDDRSKVSDNWLEQKFAEMM